MMIGSIGMAAGPSVCSAVFAASISRDHAFPFNNHLVFILMSVGIVVVAVVGWNVIDDGTTGDAAPQDEDPTVDEAETATVNGCSENGTSTGQANGEGTAPCSDPCAHGRQLHYRRGPDALSTPRKMSPLPEFA